MTDQEARDEREALRSDIAGEISGVQVGTGYESTTIGISAALEAADLLIAAGYRKSPAPEVTEEAVTRATSIIESVYGRQVADTSAVARAVLKAALNPICS